MKDTKLPLAPRYRAAINRIKGSGVVNKTLTAFNVMTGLCLVRRVKDLIFKPSGPSLREFIESTGVKSQELTGSKEGTITFALAEYTRIEGESPLRIVKIIEHDVPADRIPEVKALADAMAEGYNSALEELAGIERIHISDIQAVITRSINDALLAHRGKSSEYAPTTSAEAANSTRLGPDSEPVVVFGQS